ncbi:two-component system nitrogen regulation response regulator NtrX [Amaricoccus macauensis]|uniref:Nif-specific regulatory protein n=1 Tax=Amaricoccus macauensis TaxID=57001 RepID=A0A840SW26_9RHOB|nr:sigma-54 dependent transcriptional regulator [Amaricoccus macauensis]MBB5223351.1 two-component system nitrogen regulation response regulator NtrX [Amaricoccus macauensis]
MSDILVVDDEADIRTLIGDILTDEGHGVRLAWDSETALGEIDRAAPDLIILDIWLKDSRLDGIDILKKVKRDNPAIPVVIISGHGNIEIAVAAIKQGAYDFIEKPFNIDQLMVVIGRAMETSRLRRENAALKTRDTGSSVMLGGSPNFRHMKGQLDKVARTNSRIMLSGPAGSGKEVAARYIHKNSERAKGPFVTVNSATIGADQMEEVLFGREGPDRGVEAGLFERAHTGVLFFDEVADMPLGTQSKILRVLVDQSFQRVGGSNTVRVDVRVVSATTRDLAREVQAGRFRTELYHRLNVVPVTVPGLEARREDIPELAARFLEDLSTAQGLPKRTLTPEAEAQLQTMRWPGNVRQLRNTLERSLILGPDQGPIEPEELVLESAPNGANAGGMLGAAFAGLALREAREMFEREYLVAQINRFGGNISRTANFVGMERSALHRKLKSLNVITAGRNDRSEEAEAHA